MLFFMTSLPMISDKQAKMPGGGGNATLHKTLIQRDTRVTIGVSQIW